MGIVMLVTAHEPSRHRAFIEFTAIANLFHAVVMALFAETAIQLVLDTGFVALMGLTLLTLYPWGVRNFLRHGR